MNVAMVVLDFDDHDGGNDGDLGDVGDNGETATVTMMMNTGVIMLSPRWDLPPTTWLRSLVGLLRGLTSVPLPGQPWAGADREQALARNCQGWKITWLKVQGMCQPHPGWQAGSGFSRGQRPPSPLPASAQGDAGGSDSPHGGGHVLGFYLEAPVSLRGLGPAAWGAQEGWLRGSGPRDPGTC